MLLSASNASIPRIAGITAEEVTLSPRSERLLQKYPTMIRVAVSLGTRSHAFW